MHIRHQNGPVFLRGRTAHPFPERDLDTCGLPLEGAKHKPVPLQEIETGPVNLRQVLIDQG